MKLLKITIIFCMCLISLNIYGQDEDKYKVEIREYGNPIKKYMEEIAKSQERNTSYIFPATTLNVFFNGEVSSYFNGSSDLSAQRYYVALDADDNSFSLAYNMRLQKSNSELKKINWLLTVGLKAKSNDRFTEIYKNGKFTAKDAGATIKLTKVNNGIINYKSKVYEDKAGKSQKIFNRKKTILDYRSKFLYAAIGAEFDSYMKDDYNDDIKLLNNLLDNNQILNRTQELKDFDAKKFVEYYKKIAEEEIKYIKENKLYKSYSNNWLTLEFFIPFADNTYSIIDNNAIAPYSKTFYPFSASAAWTFFRKWSTGQSIYFTPKFTIFNNNPIIAGGLDTETLQTSQQQVGNSILIDTDEVYKVENYKNFETGKVDFEIVTFLYKDMIGFSPAVEFNFGKYDALNWKLGIPVSLKDKDGKPTVNFELQWKEIQTFNKDANHFVGISANFLFGKFLN